MLGSSAAAMCWCDFAGVRPFLFGRGLARLLQGLSWAPQMLLPSSSHFGEHLFFGGILTLGLDKHAAAALLNHEVDDTHDLVHSGSLFSGTGEQASGRVDVPGKDIQQQAAAAKDSICFFVKSLGGASLVVKTEQRATVAQVKQHVALKSGVCEEAFYLVWEGRVLREDDTLECLGVVRDTQLYMSSYLRGGVGMGRQPQIPGQWVCQACGMGGC